MRPNRHEETRHACSEPCRRACRKPVEGRRYRHPDARARNSVRRASGAAYRHFCHFHRGTPPANPCDFHASRATCANHSPAARAADPKFFPPGDLKLMNLPEPSGPALPSDPPPCDHSSRDVDRVRPRAAPSAGRACSVDKARLVEGAAVATHSPRYTGWCRRRRGSSRPGASRRSRSGRRFLGHGSRRSDIRRAADIVCASARRPGHRRGGPGRRWRRCRFRAGW